VDGKAIPELTITPEYLAAVKADMNALDAGLDATIGFACEELMAFTHAEISAAHRERLNALAIGLGCLIACTLLGIRFVRKITSTVETVSATIGDEASQTLEYARAFAQTSSELARGGSQQAAAIEEISSSMTEMHATAKSNVETLQGVIALGREADGSARDSSAEMTRLTQTMEAMKASGEQIGRIAQTIEEIAFQTNILALNASIEAARAGEAGAGFAVVAEEVRSLAKRSAESASSTRNLIERATEQIGAGHELTQNVDQKLHAIAGHIDHFQKVLQDVSVASQQQSETIGQITQAITQIDQVTQGNAAGAEQSASTAEELQRRSHRMLAATRELAALCGQVAEGRTLETDAAMLAEPAPVVVEHPATRVPHRRNGELTVSGGPR
jgi:methyl-accepting chemotaxis protein